MTAIRFEVMLVTLLISLILGTGLFLWWTSFKYRSFPGLGFPVFGHLYNALTNISTSYASLVETIDEKHKKYGDTICLWMGPFPVISTADPILIEELTASPYCVNKPFIFYGVFTDIFEGAFSAIVADEKWRQHRKAVVSSMHKDQLEVYHEVFVRRSKELLAQMVARTGSAFDIHPLVMLMTMDTVLETLCGIKKETLKNGNFKAQQAVLRAGEEIVKSIFTQFLMRIDHKYLRNLTSIFVECNEDVMENYKKGTSDLGYVPMINKIIEDKIKNQESKLQVTKAVTELMVEAHYTSAICTSGVLLYLAMYPEYQEKVIAEQREIFGNTLNDPTRLDIKRMHYLDMVIKEAVRLSTTPLVVKETSKHIQIGSYSIPEKSKVLIFWHRMRRDPKYYSHPDRFYPDHFLPTEVAARPKAAYFSFSAGPRRCPGEQYFLNMSKVILSIILRHLKLSTPLKPEDLKYNFGTFMQLKGPHSVSVEARDLQ